MQVERSVAVQLFKDLGYKTVDRWDDETLIKKLNRVPSIIEGTPDIPPVIANDPDHICMVIWNAITYKGDTITLKQEGDATMAKKKAKKKDKKFFDSIADYEGKEESKKAKSKSKTTKKLKTKAKPETKTKTKTKTSKPKKEAAGKNKFGYRIGTLSDTVDSELSTKKHKEASTIAAATQIKVAFVRMHLNHAVENNRGVKYVEGKGYIATI